MNKLYDLCVSTRKYSDNSGQEKNAYENIGAIIEDNEGKHFMTLKAHFNPAGIARKNGSESIVVSLFTPKNNTYTSSSFSWSSAKGTRLYNLAVVTHKFTDNSGQDKSAWENIGAVIMGQKSPYIMLKAHFNPAAITRKENSESIIVSLFKPKPKNDSNGYGQDSGEFQHYDMDSNDNFSGNTNDEIPF